MLAKSHRGWPVVFQEAKEGNEMAPDFVTGPISGGGGAREAALGRGQSYTVGQTGPAWPRGVAPGGGPADPAASPRKSSHSPGSMASA